MYIKSLTLKNYRCYEDLQVDFNKEYTILVGVNGAGKSTILDAVSTALGSFIDGFDGITSNGISREDAHRKMFELGSCVDVEEQYPVDIVKFVYKMKSHEMEIEYRKGDCVEKLPMRLLSDGLKTTISMVADIAYRMAVLNPQLLDNILEETPGIVLIDEVDMHLHPAWQKRIVEDLHYIFPKLQFIMTTHSPSVLANVKHEHILLLEDCGVALPGNTTYGRDVSDILREMMKVDVCPEDVVRLKADFYRLLAEEKYDLAKECRVKLEQILMVWTKQNCESSIRVLDYPSNDKDLTLRYPFIRTFEWVPVRGYFYFGERIVMGTNYYFMSRNKELMQTYFAEKSERGEFGEEYTIVDEPYLGYRCHLNKLSCGWRPLFQKHRAFDSFRKLEAFYREHQADLEIYDEYGRQYSLEEYYETVYAHSLCHPEPVKWVYEVNPMSSDKKPYLRTVGCSEEEAELYCPFNHMEYEKTLQQARQKFGVYEREYGDMKYWNDPDYLFDWTEGEFM